MNGTARLDAELVRRGLARSRGRAAALVAHGRVRVDDVVVRKPSQPVPEAVDLLVMPDTEYVSRAGHKLAGALDALELLAPGRLEVAGARCLDAGASTGGFTQALLERGAAHVLSVDVGHDQIAAVVAADPRVTVREGVNVRGLSSADVPEPVDLLVADLSFISLTLVLPALLGVVSPHGSLLLMVKPQFEVGRERLGRSGVVTSLDLREEAVLRVAAAARALGAAVHAVVPSGLPGPAGNREYFLWLAPGSAPSAPGTNVSDTDVVGMDVVDADPAGTDAAGTDVAVANVAGTDLADGVRRAVRDDVAVLVGSATVRSRP